MFRPDVVVVIADTYMREANTEAEAADFKQGDFGRAWAEGRREGITEAIMAMLISRRGETAMEHWPYVREGTRVRWDEPVRGNSGIKGAVIDAVREGFLVADEKWPPIAADIAAADAVFDLAPKAAQRHTDRAVARLVSECLDGSIVVLHEPDGPRAYMAGVVVLR